MGTVVDIIQSGSYFGLILTLCAFFAGRWVTKKTGIRALNPMVFAMVVIVAALLIFKLDYESYYESAQIISFLLGPTTVALAIPLYRQVKVLKQNWWLILISVACGALSAMLFICAFSILAKIDPMIYRSIMSKSITSAIALGITAEFGGMPELTIFAVTITGITGATFGLIACRLFRIKEPVAVGLAMGTSAHAIGTSCALEAGEVEGSMAGLAIATAGIISVIAAPYIAYLV
ncbi:MAG: LrgB family protein [Clostridiaceae bacterium]|nr:LrgB family protein [Clostridiaceae bacterium]